MLDDQNSQADRGERSLVPSVDGADGNKITTYSSISAHDNARIHNGDQYIATQNIYYTGLSQDKAASTSPHREDRELTKEEIECMRSLYKSNYRQHRDRNPKRVPGTCEWFLKHPKYVNWSTSNASSLLWVSADAGCGKSVLASFLVDRVFSDMSHENTSLCYFFFKDDNDEQRTSSSAFSAILHQILANNVQLIEHALVPFRLKGDKFSQEFLSLWDVLVAIVADQVSGRNVICILDGLDECEQEDRKQMISHLQNFYYNLTQDPPKSMFVLKFLITSRPGVLVEDTFFDLPTIRLRAEDETLAISSDIRLVVQHTISEIGRRRHLPPEQQVDLVERIVGNADRTFLWVSLVLQRIVASERFSKQALKELVETTPPDLDGVYDKILSESSQSEYTRRLLEIVVGTFRPLSLDEVNIALAIQPKNKSGRDLQLEPHIEITVKALCGVFLRVLDSTVYLAHQTAREFLLLPKSERSGDHSVQVGRWKHSFDSVAANRNLARLCNYYLHFNEFETNPLYVDPKTGDAFKEEKVNEYTKDHKLLPYAARYWPVHYLNGNLSQKDPSFESFLWLYETKSKSFQTWFPVYWISIFPSSLGPEHSTPLIIAAYLGHTDVVRRILAKDADPLTRFKSLFLKMADDPINVVDEDGMTPLSWACREGHTEMVKLLLTQRNIDINHKDSMKMTPFLRACRYGHADIVKLLLARREVQADAIDDRWKSCLSWAADGGHEVVVGLLLVRSEVNINSKDRFDKTPLHYAACGGSIKVVQALLSRPDLEINFKNGGASPLSAAIVNDHPEIFNLLLDRAVKQPNGFDIKHILFDAAREGRVETFRMLLGMNLKLLNARDQDDRTLLGVAAMAGKPEIVKILLGHPSIDVNAVDNCKCPPLMWAITWRAGNQEIVDMLLAREDIIADCKDNHGQTPLSNAAQLGCDIVVAMLLKRNDVDINSRSKKMFTPLINAATRGHSGVIKLLLAREDISVNAQESSGMTALAWAAYVNESEAVKIILDDPRVIISLKDYNGKSSFMQAFDRGYEKVGQLIIEELFKTLGVNLNQLTDGEKAELKAGLRALPDDRRALYDFDHIVDKI